jgi:hypothetical protein
MRRAPARALHASLAPLARRRVRDAAPPAAAAPDAAPRASSFFESPAAAPLRRAGAPSAPPLRSRLQEDFAAATAGDDVEPPADAAAAAAADAADELPDDYSPAADAAEFAAAFEGGGAGGAIDVSVADAQLAPVALAALAPREAYDAAARGFSWLSLPLPAGAAALVPVPAPAAAGAWAWRAWSSEGEVLGLATVTHVLAPVPPPRARGAPPPPPPPPAALAALAAIVARARRAASGGTSDALVVDAPAGGAPGGGAAPSGGAAPAGGAALPGAGAAGAADDVDPLRLPVRVLVRCTRGLLASPLGDALARAPRRVGKFLIDLHALRGAARGAVREAAAARPIVPLDAWEAEADGRHVLGLEFEAPDEGVEAPRGAGAAPPAWGARSAVGAALRAEPSLRAALRDLEVEDARAALAGAGAVGDAFKGGAGDGGAGGGGGGGGARAAAPAIDLIDARAAGATTLRTSLSVIIDAAADVIVEVAVSAPADAWDELWSGGAGGGDSGWPSARDLGLGGAGLQRIFDAATLVPPRGD